MNKLLLILLAFLVASGFASAQERDPVSSESRDASLAYIGTINFIVTDIASKCLATLERYESPQDFVLAWQERNAKYVVAASVYMRRVLEEAQAKGGAEEWNAVYREVTYVSRAKGEVAIRVWFEKDDKQKACKRVVGLIEDGAFDVTPQTEMYQELESLASWAQQ